MRRRISLSLGPEDRCGSRPAATGADRRGATGGPESQRVRPVVLGGSAAYGHVGAQGSRPAAAGAAVRHGQAVRADGRVGGEDRAPGAPAGTGIRRRGVGRVLSRAAGSLSDPRAVEPAHFRDFALSSSNQFSTTISLSVLVSSGRIIKKRWSSGATAYWGGKAEGRESRGRKECCGAAERESRSSIYCDDHEVPGAVAIEQLVVRRRHSTAVNPRAARGVASCAPIGRRSLDASGSDHPGRALGGEAEQRPHGERDRDSNRLVHSVATQAERDAGTGECTRREGKQGQAGLKHDRGGPRTENPGGAAPH